VRERSEYPGYEVETTLATHDQVEVHQARRVEDGATVVLKVFRDASTGAPVPDRFDHEVAVRRRAAGIDGFVPLLDSGPSRHGAPFVVLPFLAGGDLGSYLRGARLEPSRAVEIAILLGGVLARLHARGVVHGDLSMGNVLLRPGGEVLLTGTGSAWLPGAGAAPNRAHGPYTAPEVARGESPSVRSDVFGLGALLHRCISGIEPSGPVRPPLEPAAVGPLLSDVVGRSVAIDPADRPESILAFVAELERTLQVPASPDAPVPAVVEPAESNRTVDVDPSQLIRGVVGSIPPVNPTPPSPERGRPLERVPRSVLVVDEEPFAVPANLPRPARMSLGSRSCVGA
jgi:serine/threonine-protein kinase PknK